MPDTPRSSPLPPRHQSPRWWPVLVICVLEVIWLLWVWQRPAVQRQEQVLKTFAGGFVGIALLLLWLLGFSRLRWKIRLGVFLVLALSLAAACAFYRVTGVTGDLVPIVTARWKSPLRTPGEIQGTRSTAGQPLQDILLPDGFAGYAQFLGPTRDGIVAGPALARDWKVRPPELLWRASVGEGYSGFAIAGRHAISLEQQGEMETVVCRDLTSGATLWTHEYAARFENSLGGIGPRTTPTVVNDRVFAVGATGILRVLDLASGRLLWQRNIIADAGTTAPEWGVSGSPLVVNDLVIVHPGDRGHSLAAYRTDTGQPAWASGDARPGYSSPQLVTLLGEQQLLIFNHEGVAGHALADGTVLWTYPWSRAAQHVTDPRVIAPDRLVISTGYGAGADLIQLSRDTGGAWKTTRLWHSQRLKSKFASIVVRDSFLYGLDDGRLTCLDLATGEPRWKGDRVGHGQVLLAGDSLVVSAENGDVLLLDASPDGPRELGRFAALEGKMWNPPALAPPFLVVRTEKEAACYRLPLVADRQQ